ncbi:MAG: hypothetical protein Q9188_002161 [Gyalolechia gomerana]
MESIVFKDSPLALYLEGEGEANDKEWTPKDTVTTQPASPLQPSAFAPQGFPARPRIRRPKPPRLLNLEQPSSKGSIARLHGTCSSALDSKLGWVENGRFLEQFRYTIIASQLLNDVYNPGIYKRHVTSHRPETDCLGIDKDVRIPAFSWSGLSLTASAAFVLVWSVHWTRNAARSTPRAWSLVLTPAVAFIICSVLYLYFRRQWLHWIRSQAVESASALVAGAQNLDAVVSASINLIQEVELVCRGYRMAFEETKALAVEADLEKYYDIYEISRSEMLEAEELKDMDTIELGEDTLKAFKIGLQKLYLARKMFFCSLLALGADGGKVDFAKWSTATKTMDTLTIEVSKATQDMDEILGTGEDVPTPTHPKMPLTPGRERIRSQVQKLTSLSKGVRGLQARMHLLREDADKLAGDSSYLSATMARRYESIGTDLKELLEEWQEGQVVFNSSMDNSKNRLSLPVLPKTAPSSPTMSLGGSTAVEGSPPDALRALNGYGSCHRPSSSTATSSAGEEVFEAIALPRQRSTLNREERIANLKEDRVRQAMAKMLEARLEQAQLLKKVVDAIKDLVQDCNFDCNDSGIALQAMDNSHVALVSMMLKAESFSPFRCDRNIALGINLSSLMKVLRCAQNEDILTLKADDAPDVVNLVFETSESDRLSEYDIKLMDIDQEHLGIPETEYAATIAMPSAEFQRICRDLMALSESVAIEATKEGVKFSCTGDIGNGAVTLRSYTNVENPEKNIDISLSEPVALTFSLKYLVNFCKASGLSGTVKLCLSNEVPLLVEYTLASNSYLRFYLAPKVRNANRYMCPL